MKLLNRINSGFSWTVNEVKESAMHLGGHTAIDAVKSGVTGGHAASGTAAGIFAGGANSVAMLGGLGLTAALNAGMVQMEFNERKKHLSKLYREELAAKLGKPIKKIKERDLELLAEGDEKKGIAANHTLKEELNRQKKKRNLGVVLAAVATLAAVGIMAVAIDAGMFAAMAGAAKLIAEGLTGLVTYYSVRSPLKWTGERILEVNRETTHDKIEEIVHDREDGKTISREQVFSVFVSANKELDGFIKSKYHKSFDNLSIPQKLNITENFGKLIHLDELTQYINLGHLNATELAFAAEGQYSGVGFKNPNAEQAGILRKVSQRLHQMVDNIIHHGSPGKAPAQETMEYDNTSPSGKSFVERLGLSRADTSLGHVEQLEQSRSEQLPPNATLH